MTLHYWSLCDKKPYNGLPHTLTASQSVQPSSREWHQTWECGVYWASKPQHPGTISAQRVRIDWCEVSPTAPTVTVVTITIMLQLRWWGGEKKGIISRVEALYHSASQSAQDEKENERYYFAHLLVSWRWSVLTGPGWLFKFLKTAEECKLELRQVPPTAQLSSNVTKFSNHRVASSARVSRSPGGLFLVEIKQADRVSAKPAISILNSISYGV